MSLTTTVSALATELNLFTFQGVAATQQGIVIATLDRTIVKVSPDGVLTPIADVSTFGIPAGVTESAHHLIVAVSAEEAGDCLVRVTPEGKVSLIADLSEICGGFGAPFGVATGRGFYGVAIATDVSASTGCLAKVSLMGQVSVLADLAGYGTPFAVASYSDLFIVAQENGAILQVSASGKVTPIVNLVETGYGIPFGVAIHHPNFLVTTNSGNLLQITPAGGVTVLADIRAEGFGLPAGVAVAVGDRTGAEAPTCIVTTTTGNLVQVSLV
jgi:hypothetical protein